VFFIVKIVTIVYVIIIWVFIAFPFSLSMFFTFEKISYINLTGIPIIFTFTMWLAIDIFSCIWVSVWKLIGSLTML
jgi:hypothetical protein